MKKISLIFSLFLLINCNTKEKKEVSKYRDIVKRNVSYTNDNYISMDSNANSEKLQIPVPDLGKILLKDVIKNMDFIPLKIKGNNSKIGQIEKIINYDNYFFILDKKVTNKIYIFSQEGSFIATVGAKGKGPGEYIKIQDFTLNKEKKRIVLFDSDQNKFLFFDFSGSFIKELISNKYALDGISNIEVYDNELFFTSSNNDSKELYSPETAYNLRLLNINKKEIVSRHFNVKDTKSILLYNTPNLFYPYNGGHGYTASWENKVYHIKDGKISLAYEIDFGIEGLPKDFYEKFTKNKNLSDLEEKLEVIDKMNKEILNKKYSYLPHTFLESENHVFFRYLKNNKNQMVFYNKKSKKILSAYAQSVEGVSSFFLPIICYPMSINEKQEFIGSFSPFEVFSIYEKQKGKNTNDKKFRKELKVVFPEFDEIFSKLNKNDNPVIAIWKFKNF